MDGEIRQEKPAALRQRDRSRSELVRLRDELPPESKKRKIMDGRLELFDAQHDNTGSWKGDYFGRDMVEDLTKRGFEGEGEEQILAPRPEDLKTHYLLVNMGELDRVNAEGDHSSGDKALEAAAARIRKTLATVLKPSQFDVYRTSGNDFSVRLKNADRATAEKITHALSDAKDALAAIGPDAPMEASLASQSDMVGIINALKPEERKALFSAEKPEGPAIGVVKELLQQQNDRQKVESRMKRMQEMIDTQPAKAEEFYLKYQKVLAELFRNADEKDPPDFETFQQRFAAADIDARHRLAESEARRQYASRRDTQRGIDRTLGEFAAQQKLGIPGFPDVILKGEASAAERTENGFEPPKPTRGFAEIAKKRAKVDELKAAGADADDIELAVLDAEIEAADRNPATGLAERGRMFKQMESGLESGKPVGVVYIDLAFLKYFDKEGNDKTGNIAIKKAAELLDGIAAEASKEGILVEAYRVGGDEFAFGITGGGDDAAERIKEMILARQHEAAAIPLQGDAALGKFYKQKLSFNFGSLGPLDLEGMRKLVADNGLPMNSEPGSKEERNELAEYALRFADKQLEIQKGFNRIKLLVEEKWAGEKSGDMMRYEQLLKYSQKAIFGAEGELLIKQLSTKGEVEGEEVLKFVIDQIKKKGATKENYEDSIDKVIDARVRELYFDQQINGLKHKISILEGELSHTKVENISLKQKVAELEQEVQNVSNLKQRILAS
ncbi:diguanylate cyclase [Candidatus Uhrbacteria bacterium]|nr:MAG: diguanylate cyclase [Candidatus Uhrbacteria bacterium]